MILVDKKDNKNSGFVMLFAVVLSSIVLAMTLGVLDIALKEIKFGNPAIQSNDASFAADAGVECALFNDKSTSNVFVPSVPSGVRRVQCVGLNPIVTGIYPDFDFTLANFSSNSINKKCASVHVNKNGFITTVTSKGYNKGDAMGCGGLGAIEREYVAIVGGPASIIAPPSGTNRSLNISKAGSGTGVVTSNPAGISCGSACNALFMDGTGVDISAIPDAGFVFSTWSGDCSGSGVCSLVMDSNKNVTAAFNIPPPPSQIFFAGANSIAGTSVSIPAHQNGDLIVMFAYRDGSNTAPGLPSGWINIGTAGGANSNSSRLAYRVATGSGTTSGTWNNATELTTHVYRGHNSATPIGVNGNTGTAGTTITYPNLSLSITNGTSFVVGFAGHRSTDTNVRNAPSGMVNRISATGSGNVAGHDTNGGVPSWSSTGVSVGGTFSGWRARTLEIISN